VHVLKRLAFLALFVPLFAQAQVDGARRDPMRHFFMPTLGDLAAEAAEARAAGRQAVFIMYTRDDCPYCERMKQNILSLASVQERYRRSFAVLAVDIRGAVPLVDFGGKTVTEREFARAQGVRFSPVIVFYDFGGRPLARVAGEIRDAEEFLLLGEFVSSGAHRTQSFAEYRQSMKGT